MKFNSKTSTTSAINAGRVSTAASICSRIMKCDGKRISRSILSSFVLSVRQRSADERKAVAMNSGLYRLIRGEEDLLDSLAEAYFPNGGTDEEYDSIALGKRVNAQFPPTFVMTALGDFLTGQAKPFYDLLQTLGVRSEYHCYGSRENELKHVFHIDIKLPEARACNADECSFFKNQV